jgi:hypothetical protein
MNFGLAENKTDLDKLHRGYGVLALVSSQIFFNQKIGLQS